MGYIAKIKINAPESLFGLPCWVGRTGKVPKSPHTGAAAKSNDPKTWGTFEEAAEGLQRFKEWDGLGLMFDAAQYGVFGVDLDHVIDRETGAVDERAAAVVEALGSYAEISPSGTGVHILCRGRLPTDGGKGVKTDWLEAYEAGRYFTVTGEPFGVARPLRDATEAMRGILERYGIGKKKAPSASKGIPLEPVCLDDRALLDKAMASSNGEEFRRLWAGDTSGYGGDKSRADQALCNHLAFWTGRDAGRMDELFRASGLMRPKWDRDTGGQTYGQLTINKAIEDCREVYTGAKARTTAAQDFQAGEDEPEAFRRFSAAYSRVPGFTVKHGRTMQETIGEGGAPEYKPLADFAALPVEEVIRDDGQEQRRELMLEGITCHGKPLPAVSVPMKQFNAMGWPVEAWGLDGNIRPGTAVKDKLRYAIQSAGVGAPQRTVYTHTGWRQIGGKWAFLHSGGAIGVEQASVELEGKLGAYRLPDSSGDPLAAAWASRGLLELMPMRLSVPLVAMAYLAPLREFLQRAGCDPAFVLYLVGRTGTRKSTAAALMLSHFGAGFTAKRLPASFNDTANSIQRKAFLLKDVPLVVDDFHPTADRKDRRRMDAAAQQLARAWGDQAERGRLRADATAQAAHPPRGLGVITGEDLPSIGESGTGRAYVVELADGDVPISEALTALQHQAHEGLLAQAMRGYIEWLIPQAASLPDELGQRFEASRQWARERLPGSHGRQAEAVAWLLEGYRMALDWWEAVGAIEAQERAELWEAGRHAVLENAGAQTEAMKEENPVNLFLQTLKELIQIGEVRVAPAGQPDYGGAGLIGYRGEGFIYLLPMAAYGAVQNHMKKAGEVFPISRGTLWKRMQERGVLAPLTGGKTADNKRFGSQVVRVIPLYAAALQLEPEQIKNAPARQAGA